MKCSPWKCLLSFAGALLPAMWQAKHQRSGPRTDLVLTHLLSLLGTGWLARKKTEAAKRKPYTTSITRFRDTSASHFPALPHRLLQLWLYRRETCGFRPGMAIKSSDALVWWYSSWVPRPSVFLLIQPWPLQQPTVFESNRKKKFLWATNCLYFYWLSPQAKLTDCFSSQHYPPDPFPPPNSLSPPPNVFTAILQANIL